MFKVIQYISCFLLVRHYLRNVTVIVRNTDPHVWSCLDSHAEHMRYSTATNISFV